MDAAELFKTLVWNKLISVALQRLFLAVPLLGWGPIGFVITWAVNKIASMVYEEMKMTIELKMIQMTNEAHQKSYELACMRIVLAYNMKGGDSDEYKLARKQAHDALSEFVKLR